MKKLIAIAIATFVFLAASVISYADPVQTGKTVAVNASIGSLFGFTLWDTELEQDLGTIVPGAGAVGILHMAASSNSDLVWSIQASSTGLIGPGVTMPVVISTVGDGATVSDLILTSTPEEIYEAEEDEYPAVGVSVGGIFSVTAAADQGQGAYSGTIVLTMVE